MAEKETQKGLIVFQDRNIRRLWYDNQWFYSVVDIVEILTDSPTPRQYWGKVKDREFIQLELSPIWVQLKMQAEDGKLRYTDCVNTKNAFRLIQSIPSKKAEPFKMWLAQVGKERIEEIENPELAQDRVKEYYELKGYPKDWIDKRLRGIAIRQNLTDEWKSRGVQEERDFAILTNEISKATFGKTVGEYKQFKGLKKPNQNLRDHMTDWELIFTMLGEKATTDITRTRDAQGFNESRQAAERGGQIAQNVRRELEQETGELIVSKENYLHLTEEKKKKKLIEGHRKLLTAIGNL
ncbi:TPA: Bro-N domain-containing protein [Candidatus Woesearchaeota archaeon]|nr:Bro-N domain-containing protein [Candidatus Woesearchaeota archaeon]